MTSLVVTTFDSPVLDLLPRNAERDDMVNFQTLVAQSFIGL